MTQLIRLLISVGMLGSIILMCQGQPTPKSTLPRPNECGDGLSDRLIGGIRPLLGDYPWAALIQYRKPDGKLEFSCGGSLINSRYVLTAAHCISGIPKNWKIVGVRLGEHDLSSAGPDCENELCADPHIDMAIDKLIVHEDHNNQPRSQWDDIALIRFDRDVTFSEFIRPICLPIDDEARPSNTTGLRVTEVGWSRTVDNVAMDRFAPGEAYGGTIYKIMKAKQKGYQYVKPKDSALDDSSTASPPSAPAAPPSAPASTVQALPPPITPPPLPPVIVAPTPVPSTNPPSYIPPAPSDLNKFPPNSDTNWPTSMDSPSYNSPISSYLGPDPSKGPYFAPPDLHSFPPNVNSNYLPPPSDGQFRFSGDSSYLPPPAGPTDSTDAIPSSGSDDMIGTISVGPGRPQYLPPQAPRQQQYLPPDNSPPMSMQSSPPMMMPQPPMGMMDMPKDMGGWMGGPPEHTFPDFSQFEHDHYYPHDHYPEYVYDHHHDEMTTTTAAPPPPPEPGTARVKNYSYYYISRTLWYVPLYFTLYFCFYVLVLILRSIARHKVNIPNQWVGSRSLEAMPTLTNAQIAEKTDLLTHFVLKQIDDFKGKYIG